MATPSKLIPVTCNTDISPDYIKSTVARYIKNLTSYVGATDRAGSVKEGRNTGKMKPYQSNQIYVNFPVPDGDNLAIKAKGFGEVNRVYVWVWNSLGNHFIYRINGNEQTFELVKIAPFFNFQLNPKYFIHESGCVLDVVFYTNPETGEIEQVEDLYWTDGYNSQGYIRVDDCIATNGFDPNKFIYFKGNYDPFIFFRMGLPTPNNCISVTEIPRTDADAGKLNTLLFNGWQFRISGTDVFGRPSEHSVISDLYIPGINDCIGSNQSLPRSLNLTFDAGTPIMDTLNIEYSINNGIQWKTTETIFLYNGSVLSDWWMRQRNTSNPNFTYNRVNNTITYIFSADGEQNAIAPAETNRLENPLPRTSQAITKIEDVIGLANNKDGFLPISAAITNSMSLQVIPPSSNGSISRTMTIYVPIYQSGTSTSNKGYFLQNGNLFSSVVKNGTSGYVWGISYLNDLSFAANAFQYFPNIKQSGFVGYLNNQSLAISTQVYIDSSGNEVNDINFAASSLGLLAFHKFVFTDVRPGNYIFRIASCLADPTTLGVQTLAGNGGTFNNLFETSLPIWGVCPFTKNGYNIDINNRVQKSELLINVCDSDYHTFNNNPNNEILTILSILDDTQRSTGYVYETKSNVVSGANQNPVELLQILATDTGGSYATNGTDHNGFFWVISNPISGGTHPVLLGYFTVYFIYKCQKINFNIGITNSAGSPVLNAAYLLDEIGNFYYNTPPPIAPDFSTQLCNRIEVTGRIVLISNNSIGVPNVIVSLTRGQSTTTDDNGNYTIIAHDDVANGVRNDVVVFSGSVCNYKNEDGGCIPTQPVQILPCVYGTCSIRAVIVTDFDVTYTSQRGLLSGGTYGVGYYLQDWLKRVGDVQPIGKLKIPSIIESQAIGVSSIEVTLPLSITFPSYVDSIIFCITKELTIEDYIDWIVDSFDLIDNTGQINPAAPTQIRIYYASLRKFNQENNYNTTTNWEFLEPLPIGQTTGSQQPYTSDIVQFLYNGNQNFYFGDPKNTPPIVPKLITALVKYDQTGQYFLIDYTSELAGLQSKALIRLVRPRDSSDQFEEYNDVCKIVKVINGKAQETQFILNAFDTYYLDRQIPIPTPLDPTQPTLLQYTEPDPSNGNIINTFEPATQPTAPSLTVFPFPFESDSPSNFWGKGIKNIGRVNTINPYETEILSINQVALTGSLSKSGALSYLQYFDDAQKFDLPMQNTGGIYGLIFDIGKVYVITQYDNMLFGFNDNRIQLDDNGNVIAPSAQQKFGNPQRVPGENYGCQAIDKNSIQVRNGLVMFADRSRGEIMEYDYSNLKSMTKDKCDSWFRAKCKSMQNDPNRYFVFSINPITNELLVTDFSLNVKSYINNERTYLPEINETVSFDIASRDLNGWVSFTPEMYAYLDGDILNSQLFSFKGALPYSHYNLNTNNSYNTFYGVVCSRVFRLISNLDNFKVKMFRGIELYGNSYFADEIFTSSNQKSRLMLSAFDKRDNFYVAAFMADLNTPPDSNMPIETGVNKIMDGNPLYGNYIDIRLIGNPADDNKYTEVLGIIVNATGQSDTGGS